MLETQGNSTLEFVVLGAAIAPDFAITRRTTILSTRKKINA